MKKMYLVLFALLSQLMACSTVDKIFDTFGKDEAATEPSQPHEAVQAVVRTDSDEPATLEQIELRQARMWSRLDALESQIREQKAHIKLLQKGLMLGIVPDELKDPRDLSHDVGKPAEPMVAEPSIPRRQDVVPEATEPEPSGIDKKKAYEALVANAQEAFRLSQYGRAIAAYAEIGERYGEFDENGNHKYWIALSWANLKEYELSKEHLVAFIQNFPSSPWVPRAKLYRARVEKKLGYSETALKLLRDLIKEHPYEDAAKMAKNEIEELEQAL